MISGSFKTYVNTKDKSKYKITGQTTGFEVTPVVGTSTKTSVEVKDKNYFNNAFPSITRAYLLSYYVFVDVEERIRIIESDKKYLIPMVQHTSDIAVFSHSKDLKLTFVHPCIDIHWRVVFDYNKNIKEFFKYETDTGDNTVKKSSIILDGQERVRQMDSLYYSGVQTQSYDRAPQTGINSYSFALYPNQYQPSGTLNMSEVRDIVLKMNLDKSITYQNTAWVQVYARHYNILVISNGRASLMYSDS